MNRRDWLRAMAAATTLASTGWASATARARAPRRRGPPEVDLTPVEVSRKRIQHTTVGLRPLRPEGFRVEATALGDKTVIHHYGHGGAGMSLSWGTAYLAAQIAQTRPERTAAILGAGVAGLTAARQLQRRGFTVTLYAAAVPPNTTSNRSLASWTPTSNLLGLGRRTERFDASYATAVDVAYRELTALVGDDDYGVSWVDAYSVWEREPPNRRRDGALPNPAGALGREVLPPGSHPFPYPYATKRKTLRIEPGPYLNALVRDVRRHEGRFVQRSFDALADLAALTEPIVVNCMGLRGGELFDDMVIPVKGQLTVLKPQPAVDYAMSAIPVDAAGMYLHTMPRRDGIVLGGLAEPYDATTTVDEAALARILEGHATFFESW
ncbi:MAG: FAD-binding oxidoreductase [Myxococcales bacterium]|nr:FAD-binding oxidoreductase [Myxococcales bacterium]